MAKRTYPETLAFLFEQLPMFQRVGPMAFKKDLTNIRALCEALGQPHERLRAIHIAGTNGKGSTAHMLASVLQAAGLKVGLYTSPHYRDFRERIKINGELMPEEAVVDFVEQYETLFQTIKPSFFEITVAMAFDYFAKKEVDWAVVEVGMGGRLDSTNILMPELCVITNISYDHMQFLGETLPEIAGEKAGIIKPGIQVVISETQEETQEVFLKKAAEESAPIIFADQQYEARLVQSGFEVSHYDIYRKGALHLEQLELNAYGEYQRKNLQAVLQAIEWLHPKQLVSEIQLRAGLRELLASTRFIGRWQVLGKTPLILCDSAHNEAGISMAMQELDRLSYEKLHIVYGMVSDKDPEKVLRLLPREATYYFARPDIPRGLEAAKLAEVARRLSLKGLVYPSVNEALEAARNEAGAEDLIYVGGSIFVVAEVV
ncbi:folylpolyglutamate synthase/dihydrofolate synthase family protein [Phaeodactylibacter sp.]|uniref:bifunctional folylpolyglutamate synthase/dihydrofolate synthase n=1 Tax=Phaeodactylibacter sp. TaxID=1940289 RepID=UPI0025EA0774|nr:folylpolyglutamate synthase/dihydrofolate synthase family protein [Phaeodactylibacter sp.]MCI4651291.1 bifunctional folylpolyglutamate synthase/dihydrofolate synthase [Phaeodactylibacter sp.]MCI5092476.1 bifunctional folylpolyglutamate synthase/dihydrofolate synthase [Phaeodactylibacter sp.]